MEAGQYVRLRAFGGKVIERRVVRVQRDVIAVCTDAEYHAAQEERREPLTVGFRWEYLVND